MFCRKYSATVLVFVISTLCVINCAEMLERRRQQRDLKLLEFLLDNKDKLENLIHKKNPLLEAILKVHEVVEPLVTLAEIFLLIEQKAQLLTQQQTPHHNNHHNHNHNHNDPANVMVFKGNNKILVNHIKPHVPPYYSSGVTENHILDYNGGHKIEDDIAAHANRHLPEVPERQRFNVEASSVHSIKTTPTENTFVMNIKSHNAKNQFHLFRDLPSIFYTVYKTKNEDKWVAKGKPLVFYDPMEVLYGPNVIHKPH